jgi:hypothetical protein
LSEKVDVEMHTKILSFVTSALLAVEIARVNGDVSEGEFASSMFISRWIKKAIKQKRFHRDLVNVINTFVGKGSKACHIQRLKTDLNLILSEYQTVRLKDVVFEQPEISRLNTALDLIAAAGVKVQVPLDYDPVTNGPYDHKLNRELFILKSDYVLSVDSDKLKRTLSLYMVGDRQPIIDILFQNGFISEVANKSSLDDCHYTHLRIYPKNNVLESIGIPTKFL